MPFNIIVLQTLNLKVGFIMMKWLPITHAWMLYGKMLSVICAVFFYISKTADVGLQRFTMQNFVMRLSIAVSSLGLHFCIYGVCVIVRACVPACVRARVSVCSSFMDFIVKIQNRATNSIEPCLV
jgi:hypothetical protein